MGGLFRRTILPFFKANARTMAGNAAKTGMNVAGDIVQGEPVTRSMKKRIPEGIKETARKLNWQTGSRPSHSKHRRTVSRKPRRYNDIFG